MNYPKIIKSKFAIKDRAILFLNSYQTYILEYEKSGFEVVLENVKTGFLKYERHINKLVEILGIYSNSENFLPFYDVILFYL